MQKIFFVGKNYKIMCSVSLSNILKLLLQYTVENLQPGTGYKILVCAYDGELLLYQKKINAETSKLFQYF